MAIKSHKQQQQQQQQRLNTHLQDLKYKHYYPLGFNLYCIVMPCVEWKRGHQNRKKIEKNLRTLIEDDTRGGPK